MEMDLQNCEVCYNKYDKETHIPMCLPQCRHTICKHCMNHVLKDNMAKCPFDRKRFYFHKDRTYLAPQVNLYVLNSLQSLSTGYEECSEHREPLKYYCFICKEKICSDCYAIGKHKSHQAARIDDLTKKISNKKRTLELCREGQANYTNDLTSLLGKRMFEELETVENLYKDQEEILKKQKLEVKFKTYVAYKQAEKRTKSSFGDSSAPRSIIAEKIATCKNMENPKLIQAANENIEDALSQFSKQKLAEEIKGSQQNLELKSQALNQCLVQQLSRQPHITWEDFDYNNENQRISLEDQSTPLNLSFGSTGYKIKSNFAITINEERLNLIITESSGDECLIDIEQLKKVKVVNVDIRSLWFNEEYLEPLGYVFNKLSSLKSLSVSCEDFQVNDALNSLQRRLKVLLEAFFSQTQELTNIRIHWKATYGSDEVLKSLVKELRLKKLELQSLELCFEKDILSYYTFQNLIQNLQPSQNTLETLKLLAIMSYCTREGELKSLELPKLRNLVWNVECSCQQCKESFHEMTRKFLLDCFGTMKSLEKLEFSLMITENLKEENFVKIFEMLKEFQLLEELKVIMSDVGKGNLIKTKGLVKLVGYVVQHISQMLKLQTLCMGVKLGECHTLTAPRQILEFLAICLEQSMKYQ